ncbi:ADP-heptose synthase / D-glycero-beta-D-manno-heptose 7-phosphate kinase [hydrothermal vent metagenome]|uniref:ADP-heptose synthase / D-glycero-beta-D-manno-heptose 7-phosphate kinase n=1 Tax=hydrothermal vent metagenome TaxID=652676 RepID=A0A3B0TGZ5_9ZZZZ
MNHLARLKSKIFPGFPEFSAICNKWKKNGDKIVFTNGCFDFIHRGHIDYLAKSADKGDKLVVGLNTDESVSLLKGPLRPLVDQQSRAIILAALEFVDAIVLFPEETPYRLIKDILPDVLIKGNDYAIEEIAGFDVVLGHGGIVTTIELIPGYSSTALIEKIRQLK